MVLYFYPKDDTPGCTTEVCTFRDDVAKLHKQNAEVLGVSLDDVKSHEQFAEKYHVPFPLLSDNAQTTAKSYGVLATHLNFTYARRETFLIDPQGKVAKHYKDVDPKANSGQSARRPRCAEEERLSPERLRARTKTTSRVPVHATCCCCCDRIRSGRGRSKRGGSEPH